MLTINLDNKTYHILSNSEYLFIQSLLNRVSPASNTEAPVNIDLNQPTYEPNTNWDAPKVANPTVSGSINTDNIIPSRSTLTPAVPTPASSSRPLGFAAGGDSINRVLNGELNGIERSVQNKTGSTDSIFFGEGYKREHIPNWDPTNL